MKKFNLILLTLILFSTTSCGNNKTEVDNNKALSYHSDSFVHKDIIDNTSYNDDVDTEDKENTESSESVKDTEDIQIEFKEHNVPEYTEEELKKFNEEYNEQAEPNIIVDSESNNAIPDTIVEKEITVDGKTYKAFINE